jgi:hypothetical protein
MPIGRAGTRALDADEHEHWSTLARFEALAPSMATHGVEASEDARGWPPAEPATRVS